MIAAEGEQKASRALREASDVITESAAALQLRYLQVVKLELDNLKFKILMVVLNLLVLLIQNNECRV